MMQDQSLLRFLDLLRRRRWSAGGTALAVAVAGALAVAHLPAEYEARAVVRMDEGQPPKDYVMPTVTEIVSERLKAIRLELLDRPLITEVGRSAGLFEGSGPSAHAAVDQLRSRFDVKVEGVDTFILTYKDSVPARAARIVNALCKQFTAEHEQHLAGEAERTKELFDAEVENLREAYQKLEGTVEAYRRAHDGALPEQLDANLHALDEIQADINSNQGALAMAEDRKRALATQELDYLHHQENVLADTFHTAETTYAPNQAEVVNARREYEQVRAEREKEEAEMAEGLRTSPEVIEAQQAIDDARSTLRWLREQQAKLRTAVGETADNAEALARLSTERDVIHQRYQEAIAKDEEAGLAAMEEARVASPARFEILEAAVEPSAPTGPNRPLLLGIAFGAAVCLGIGAGLLHEAVDTTIFDPEDVQGLDPRLHLVACVPHTPPTTRRRSALETEQC